MDEITIKVAEQAEGVLTEVYKHGISPAVQPIGIMLSYLPRTIRLAFTKWEKWIVNGEESLRITGELLKVKLKDIPEEKICEPEPYVAIPAIQQLCYCQDSDELRNMYANLLASSMNVDTKWKVHPSFTDIIKQLTPDEAKLLKQLPPNKMIYHPLIDVQLHKKSQGGYNTLISNFTNWGLNVIDIKGNICSYIENLERLKLIEIPADASLSTKELYIPLKEHPILKSSVAPSYYLPDSSHTVDYKYKLFNITNFGISFVNTCCK